MSLFKNSDLEEKLANERKEAEERDAERRAAQLGLPYLNLVSVKVPTELKAIALVPEAAARAAKLCPLQLVGKKLVVAVFDPNLPAAVKIIENLKTRYEVTTYIASANGLAHGWNHYQYIPKEQKEITGSVEISQAELEKIKKQVVILKDLTTAVSQTVSAATSELAEIVLGGALALKASDIHLEPAAKDSGVIRLRLDGLLYNVFENLTVKTFERLISRIKLLSNLKLNIEDEAQDGRFTIKNEDRDIEIRVSIIPSEFGETAVLRILDPLSLKTELAELGWRADDLAIVQAELKKPNGLILNTGPTGSGKTTTLYAFLKAIAKPEIKIITIEDPIEYHLPGISQTQVDPGAGYTFASGLRSILRQDPDVVLVGEIRDQETTEIALNASLTGHLVFSTLHTNNAAGAIPRLIDLKAQNQIIAAGLNLIIAQRLIRRLCPQCKKPKAPDNALENKIREFLKQLPARVDQKLFAQFEIFEPAGCAACNQLGYRGRISIFELLMIDEKIEEAIAASPSELALQKMALAQGMVPMQADGLLKVLAGVSNFDEVERVTGPIKWG